MATYRVTGPDGATYKITAPDDASEEQVLEYAKSKFGESAQKSTQDRMSSLRGAMNEAATKEYANRHPIASKAATFLQGVPFVGEYLDEAMGVIDPANVEKVRALQAREDEQNPALATGLRIGGGVVGTVPAALAAAPSVAAAAPASLGAQMLSGFGLGVLSGGTEGAVSGYGAGTDAESRKQQALIRGGLGAGIGGVLGGVMPLAAKGLDRAAKYAIDATSVDRAAAKQGISRPASKVLVNAMNADDSLSGAGASRLAAMGDDAMLADAGPTARSVLDTTVQRSGAAGRTAKDAVEMRAARAGERLKSTFDDILGVPEEVRSVAKDISRSTSGAREAAYTAAYTKPIDYASGAGRSIEDVLARVPSKVLRRAVDEANDAMTYAGVKNQQILAEIADDGSVVFREMPNVQQLDFIKRSLGEIGAESVDQFGRPTGAGVRASKLASDLRDALKEAVPEYGAAVKLGGDKIAEDKALRLGSDVLTRRISRADVKEFARTAADQELSRAKQGLRASIEDMMSNVKRAVTDGNMDAREAVKALRELSSRANRDKVSDLLGPKDSAKLFRELTKTTGALDLRAGIADNSRTYARQAMEQTIGRQSQGGAVEALKRGEPVNAIRRITQSMTNRTPENILKMEDRVYEDIARILTQQQGPKAQETLRVLMEIAKQSPENALIARDIANQIAAGGGALAYQTGSQLAAPR